MQLLNRAFCEKNAKGGCGGGEERNPTGFLKNRNWLHRWFRICQWLDSGGSNTLFDEEIITIRVSLVDIRVPITEVRAQPRKRGRESPLNINVRYVQLI